MAIEFITSSVFGNSFLCTCINNSASNLSSEVMLLSAEHVMSTLEKILFAFHVETGSVARIVSNAKKFEKFAPNSC